jgi:hypothetical protein
VDQGGGLLQKQGGLAASMNVMLDTMGGFGHHIPGA